MTMTNRKKSALITGIAGQDGTYLAELLLQEDYQVIGTVRDVSRAEGRVPQSLRGKVQFLQAGDNSQGWYDSLIREHQPSEVYNLAGLSYVPATADDPAMAAEEIAMSAIRLYQAVRRVSPATRVYQACSSEMFGSRGPHPQDEETLLVPVSPYGAAKAYTFFAANQYRELFKLYFVTGICFNHESPRRPPNFVSRRITQGAAKIKLGFEKSLHLGALDARRDWGFAKDYVRAMWLMLQQEKPENYVIATGILHTVSDMVQIAFDEAGLNWEKHVVIDRSLVRANESRPLVGNPARARQNLGWEAEVKFEELIRMMVRADLDLLKQ